MRINKFVSRCGCCSRRMADMLLEQGRITVNGIVPPVGTMVGPDDIVAIDGKTINIINESTIYAFYKPKGYISSLSDRQGAGISRFIPQGIRLYPVGRLDKESEGLMLLTNDGDVMNEILNAANQHQKEYIVTVKQKITEEFINKMSSGVLITNAANGKKVMTAPCSISGTGTNQFRIILTQGLNRQIRRMCGCLGYEVEKLIRVRIMNITIDGMKPGDLIMVDDKNAAELRNLIKRRDGL